MGFLSASANLNFLRSVAILFIIFHHAITFLGFRTLGVIDLQFPGYFSLNLLFFHTACVLMFHLEREEKKYGSKLLAVRFIIKRAFRLYPAAIVILMVVIIFQIPSAELASGHLEYTDPSLNAIVANLLLIHNWIKDSKIIGSFWTIPYQMQAYFLFPAMYLLIKNKISLLVFFILIVASYKLNNLLNYPIQAFNQSSPVFQIPVFLKVIPYFLLGFLPFILLKYSFISKRFQSSLNPLGFILMVIVFYVGITVYGKACPHLAIFFIFILAMAIPFFADIQNPLMGKVFDFISKHTYSLYLTHYLCIWFAFMLCKNVPFLGQLVIFVLTITFFSMILFRCVEQPLIKLGKSFSDYCTK